MAKVKLTLDAPLTFKRTVDIPTPEGLTAEVGFVFKHRDKVEMAKLMDAYYEKARRPHDEEMTLEAAAKLAIESDIESVLDVAEGWDLPYDFNADSLRKLFMKYAGAALAIITEYKAGLLEGRRKN
jgi:predicted P-loop ATPase